MPRIYLSLGSNIGDKEKLIREALHQISKRCEILKTSPLYHTEPISTIPQDWFLNCAVEAQTTLDPEQLLSFLQSIEQRLGRLRTEKNGPRTIDIDILFYDDQIIRTQHLVIPHPHLQERLFVLQPMMDLNPSFLHPILKKTIQELYTNVPKDKKVQRYK